ncbi:MAG: GNAT family N-acetyltransferase [Clostridia bacterium]|nr:GNAT family N-acetyltransferase [Clostridia bacterium]
MPAEDRHALQLVGLSREFASEQPWAATIPIGQIHTVEAARQRLFGPDVVVALMAETLDGTAVGYIGVSRFFADGDAHYEASILVGRDWRTKGVGRALVDEAFLRLPPGICVEAWRRRADSQRRDRTVPAPLARRRGRRGRRQSGRVRASL